LLAAGQLGGAVTPPLTEPHPLDDRAQLLLLRLSPGKTQRQGDILFDA
jgi:hypothetical protein